MSMPLLPLVLQENSGWLSTNAFMHPGSSNLLNVLYARSSSGPSPISLLDILDGSNSPPCASRHLRTRATARASASGVVASSPAPRSRAGACTGKAWRPASAPGRRATSSCGLTAQCLGRSRSCEGLALMRRATVRRQATSGASSLFAPFSVRLSADSACTPRRRWQGLAPSRSCTP